MNCLIQVHLYPARFKRALQIEMYPLSRGYKSNLFKIAAQILL
jgi:hypothetical protein